VYRGFSYNIIYGIIEIKVVLFCYLYFSIKQYGRQKMLLPSLSLDDAGHFAYHWCFVALN